MDGELSAHRSRGDRGVGVVGGIPTLARRNAYIAAVASHHPGSGAFSGFGPAVTDWFVALASDDSRAFWQATRDVWQRDIRSPLEALLTELAAEAGGRVKLFRPYRDMRYASAGAGPIKPQAGGLVRTAESASSRYVEVSIEGFYAGRGMYRFERDQLERFRAAALEPRSGERLAALLARAEADALEIGGDALKTVPRGVARDHPRAALLRRKGLFLGATLPPGAALETSAPRDHARRVWAAADEVIAWLDAYVGPSELPRPGRR